MEIKSKIDILKDLKCGDELSQGYDINYFVSNLPKIISKIRKQYGITIYGKREIIFDKTEYVYRLGDDSKDKVVALLSNSSLNSVHYDILEDLISTYKKYVYAKYSNPYDCKNLLQFIKRLEKKGLKFKREWKESEKANIKYRVVSLEKNINNMILIKELLASLNKKLSNKKQNYKNKLSA